MHSLGCSSGQECHVRSHSPRCQRYATPPRDFDHGHGFSFLGSISSSPCPHSLRYVRSTGRSDRIRLPLTSQCPGTKSSRRNGSRALPEEHLICEVEKRPAKPGRSGSWTDLPWALFPGEVVYPVVELTLTRHVPRLGSTVGFGGFWVFKDIAWVGCKTGSKRTS